MFIQAKSKLAPLKERLVTIPKVELQAAARMIQRYRRSVSSQKQYFFGLTQKLSFNIIKMKKVTFHYLLCITFIRHYIPSEQNPADLCTGSQSDFKLNLQKWFHGPENFRSKGAQY